MSYKYRVVTRNGAGVHSQAFGRCADAKRCAQVLAEQDADARVKLAPFEIERVEHVSWGGHRYWMRQKSRWVMWDTRKGPAERMPDWIFGAEAGEQ